LSSSLLSAISKPAAYSLATFTAASHRKRLSHGIF